MSAFLGSLREAIGSASKIFNPRKRGRDAGFADDSALLQSPSAEDLGNEKVVEEEEPEQKKVALERKDGGLRLQNGAMEIRARSSESVVTQHQGAVEQKPQQVMGGTPSAFSIPRCEKKENQPSRSRRFANALDQYAYLRTVQKYENSGSMSRIRRMRSPRTSERTILEAEFGGKVETPYSAYEATPRRLSYGASSFTTPELSKNPILSFPSFARTSGQMESNVRDFFRQRLEEQKRIEEENIRLKQKIEEIEKKSAPVHPSVSSHERLVISDLLGEGVNNEVIRRKMDKLDIPIQAIQDYRRRQAQRQREILSREKSIALLHTEGLSIREDIVNHDAGEELGVDGDEEVEAQELRNGDEEPEEILDSEPSEEESDEDDREAAEEDESEMDDEAEDNDLLEGISVVDESDSFSELTDDAKLRVKRATSPNRPAGEILVQMNNMELRREDMLRLQPQQWLNDEIINCYITLLQERNSKAVEAGLGTPDTHFFNTFFYTRLVNNDTQKYEFVNVRRWTRKFDVFKKEVIVIPINHGNFHWTCAAIDNRKKQMTYYDSMGGRNQTVLDNLFQWMEDESRDKKKQEVNLREEGWEQSFPGSSVPQQTNGDDCGVFTCKFADYISRDKSFDFSAEDMSYFRLRMVAELLAKRAC